MNRPLTMNRWTTRPFLFRMTIATAVSLAAVVAYQNLPRQVGHAPAPDAGAAHESASEPPGDAVTTRIELLPEKFETAHIHCTPVTRQPLRQMRTVPGKVGYRSVRRVDLKAPVDAIVREVLTKPGAAVHPGARLAMLDSPEIGMARAEVERSRVDLTVAQRADDWAQKILKNLQDLLKLLDDKPPVQEVERVFDSKTLGTHWQQVLGAYSKYILAEKLWEAIQAPAERGSVSEQLLTTRETNREVTQAEFRGACEQSRFDALQQSEKAHSAMLYAARMFDVSRQRLKMQLGAFSELVELPDATTTESESLTRFYVIAPFEGTVEQRLAANTQRVLAGTLLFVVADTTVLEVYADIRERDWQALTLQEGQPVTVQIPFLKNREFTAIVDYVGRSVLAETQAVPLIATIENKQGWLRPGMFAWVSLPAEETTESLVVPPSALMTHEGQKFVFVADGPRAFRRVDVTTGVETRQWVAITSGLQAEQQVVDAGAFALKSELLLPAEEE